MFDEIDRPELNRRRLGDKDLSWDQELEAALRRTLITGRAIVVPLVKFHSSPCKGRLWKAGFRVLHRAVGGNAAAWLVRKPEKEPKEKKPPIVKRGVMERRTQQSLF